MGFVKGIVIGMGVLIVAGFIVIAVTLVMRVQGTAEPTAIYRAAVGLPQGAKVVESSMADGLVLLRIIQLSGDEALILVSAKTGEEKGRIALVSEGP